MNKFFLPHPYYQLYSGHNWIFIRWGKTKGMVPAVWHIPITSHLIISRSRPEMVPGELSIFLPCIGRCRRRDLRPFHLNLSQHRRYLSVFFWMRVSNESNASCGYEQQPDILQLHCKPRLCASCSNQFQIPIGRSLSNWGYKSISTATGIEVQIFTGVIVFSCNPRILSSTGNDVGLRFRLYPKNQAQNKEEAARIIQKECDGAIA